MRQTVQQLVSEAKSRIREIDAAELAALQARGVPVIDVREPAEYAAGHVPGAAGIPRGVLEFEVDGHPGGELACATRPWPIATSRWCSIAAAAGVRRWPPRRSSAWASPSRCRWRAASWRGRNRAAQWKAAPRHEPARTRRHPRRPPCR